MTRAAVATLATVATAVALPASAHALALSVTTDSPQNVTTTQATLRATLSVSLLGGSVAWQYGTTTRYGTTTGSRGAGLLGVAQTMTLGVDGLTPDTTYHVRAVAASGLTTSYGRDVSFTTAALSPPPSGSGSGSSGSGSGSGSGDTDSSGSGTSGSGTSGSGTSGSGTSGSGTSGSGSSDSGSGATTTTATTTTTSGAKSAESSMPSGSSSAGETTDTSDDDAGATPSGEAPVVTPGAATAAVTPVLGKSMAVATVVGTVTATSPSGDPVDLGTARAVPNGTLIDARAGTVELTTALNRNGATQTGHFWGSLFELRQTAAGHGLTQLVLRGGDFSSCKATNKAVARAAKTKAKKKGKPSRSLWGSDDHGRFQTRGRGSVATVRGTHWLTQDTCAGTLTRVVSGAVAVRDLRRHRTIIVRRGHQHLVRLTR